MVASRMPRRSEQPPEDSAALEAARQLTSDEVHAGLFPKTMADLKYRPIVFAVLARGDAAFRKRGAKKKN